MLLRGHNVCGWLTLDASSPLIKLMLIRVQSHCRFLDTVELTIDILLYADYFLESAYILKLCYIKIIVGRLHLAALA